MRHRRDVLSHDASELTPRFWNLLEALRTSKLMHHALYMDITYFEKPAFM